jgi:dTMP kinase
MLIALEGIDGSGKGTQADLLIERARSEGLDVETYSFPRYGTNAYAEGIGRYLNGEFGDVNHVPAEFAALLYAGDRLACRDALAEAAAARDLLICDRYVPSNLAHQGAKLDPDRRAAFIDWLIAIEYGIHALPRPDLVLLFDVPVDLAMAMVHKKARRSYTDMKADIHEGDRRYLTACRDVFHTLAEREPDRWLIVPCTDGAGAMRPQDEIAEYIWEQVCGRRS